MCVCSIKMNKMLHTLLGCSRTECCRAKVSPDNCSVFTGITADGEKEEYLNEQYRLADLDIFIPALKLVERQGNHDEKLLNAEISNLIGRRLHDFDVMGAEVCI